MKSIHVIFVCLIALALSGVLRAQAIPTATRSPVQIGVAGSIASSDFGPDYIKGFTLFGDLNFSRRLGVEAEFHDTSLSTPDNAGEQTYLVGPRYSIALEERANIYVKVLGGFGRFTYEPPQYIRRTFTYGVAAAGAGIEFRASSHFNVRAIDVEYQTWPGFPPHGLSPFVATIGIAYVH
jgi:hypothetical protein